MSEIFAIDLGSGYTRCGAVLDGVISMIPLKNDDKIMPSIVSFRNGKCLVGVDAKKNVPDNIIFDACKVYRKDYLNPCFASDIDGAYQIRPTPRSQETEKVTRQEAISILLDHVKQQFEKKTSSSTRKVVITIPDFTPQHHKKVILQGARIAELETVLLLPQSTAAAIFYNLNTVEHKDRTFMIFNMGSGCTSVSVFTRKNGHTELIFTAGDTNLGGEDVTNGLLRSLVESFKEKIDPELMENKKNLMILRENCETGKIHLSNFYETKLSFDLVNEQSYSYKLSRHHLERYSQKLFDRIEAILIEALLPLRYSSHTSIDEVLLIGGSSRIPKIKELILKHLPDIKFNSSIVPEEAVVRGAAINAAILSGNQDLSYADVQEQPVLPIYASIRGSHVRVNVIKKVEMVPSRVGKEAIMEIPSAETPLEVNSFALYESGGECLGSLHVHDSAYLYITFKLDRLGLLQTWITKYPHGKPERVELAHHNPASRRPALLTKNEINMLRQKKADLQMPKAISGIGKLHLDTRNKVQEPEPLIEVDDPTKMPKPQEKENVEPKIPISKPARTYAEVANRQKAMLEEAMQEASQPSIDAETPTTQAENEDMDQTLLEYVKVLPRNQPSAPPEEPQHDVFMQIDQHYSNMIGVAENQLKHVLPYEVHNFSKTCKQLQHDLRTSRQYDHDRECQHMHDCLVVLNFKNDVLERVEAVRIMVKDELGSFACMWNHKFRDALYKAGEAVRNLRIDFKGHPIAFIQEVFVKFESDVRLALMGEKILQKPEFNQLLQKSEPRT